MRLLLFVVLYKKYLYSFLQRVSNALKHKKNTFEDKEPGPSPSCGTRQKLGTDEKTIFPSIYTKEPI
jgi:hypothetical protein